MNLSFNCHHLYCIVPSSVLRNLKLSIDDLCVRACLWTACACETVNCFLNSEELILLQPMALICEACGTQRHKEVAKFKVWFGLVWFCYFLFKLWCGFVWEHALHHKSRH
ncbi:hypothetical protein BDE02_10G224400 [Populus trichocarpa]|nr:hypothetical protein BDE02_10G224400 [Populus trichocarpa]